MLSFAGDGDTQANLLELNILPTSISYEYDPNDYLKVREFLMKRRDPNFKKSQRDESTQHGNRFAQAQKVVCIFILANCINEEYSKYTFANRN